MATSGKTLLAKKLLAVTLSALTLSAVAPLGALASAPDQSFGDTGQRGAFEALDSRDVSSDKYSYGPGFYLGDPSYPYVPQGGNSGGENFPHSGT